MTESKMRDYSLLSYRLGNKEAELNLGCGFGSETVSSRRTTHTYLINPATLETDKKKIEKACKELTAKLPYTYRVEIRNIRLVAIIED